VQIEEQAIFDLDAPLEREVIAAQADRKVIDREAEFAAK
jgi:hypothetical protein